jgi:hypothetical protein
MRTHALFYRCADGGNRPPSASLPCALPCRSFERGVLEWLSRALLVAGLILFSFATAQASTYELPIARGIVPRSYILDRHTASGSIQAQPPGVRSIWYLGNDSVYTSEEVFVFLLPVLGVNETVDGANLKFYAEALGTPLFNVDLYGIGINESGEPLVEFLDSDIPDAGNTRLQNNLLTPLNAGDANLVRTTDATGGAALATYLSNFYTDNPGYAGGSYVYLRLNPDGTESVPLTGQWRVALNGSGLINDPYEPILSFTTVPEPSTVALAAIGAAALLAVRRRKVLLSLN